MEMEVDTSEDNGIDEMDEVVFETDVYLSKALSESLYLFHYPTRNCVVDLEEDLECLTARIKPKQQKLEMELGINIHADAYDRSKGEQMAYNVDGQNTTGEPYFQSSLMDKYRMTGSKACNSTETYALGFLRKGELHVTPLHSVMELRSGFVHMDKIDNASKKALNPDEEEEEEAVAVTVRFEGANAERDRQIRQKSYQYLQQKNATEPWITVNYHKLGSGRSMSECDKLLCSQMYRDVSSESINPQDYLKDLLPEVDHISGYIGKEEEANMSQKTVSDQMKRLMINGHILTFPMLLEKLPFDVSKVELLQRIQQFAVLVRGCWAVKSELLYIENSTSPYSGMSAKLLVNARDYVLWLFTKSKFLTRKEVLSVIYVPDDDFKSMISPMAIKTNRGWEFKFPHDKEFVESHPAIEQSQDMKWNLRYKKLVNDLGVCESEGESSKASYTVPSRSKHKRHSRSSISEGDESGTDSGAPGVKDTKTKRVYIAKKRSALGPSKHGLKSKPFHIATLDISPTFLETSPPESLKAELRDCVGDAIRNKFCMTLSEMKELVLDSHLNSIASRSDFEKLLEEALIDYGAEKLKNKWPQHTAPEILYAFAKFGNKLDRYRTALLELFSTTARARTNLFVKKVEDELRELVSESDCRQIFGEYCVYKSGFYYLKGTIALDP